MTLVLHFLAVEICSYQEIVDEYAVKRGNIDNRHYVLPTMPQSKPSWSVIWHE
jgi:hypothetical protein